MRPKGAGLRHRPAPGQACRAAELSSRAGGQAQDELAFRALRGVRPRAVSSALHVCMPPSVYLGLSPELPTSLQALNMSGEATRACETRCAQPSADPARQGQVQVLGGPSSLTPGAGQHRPDLKPVGSVLPGTQAEPEEASPHRLSHRGLCVLAWLEQGGPAVLQPL